MSKFNILVLVMIFIIIALVITGIVSMVSSWAAQDACRHTQLQELQKSGDYYSCLGVK
jgi:hypothetical protein